MSKPSWVLRHPITFKQAVFVFKVSKRNIINTNIITNNVGNLSYKIFCNDVHHIGDEHGDVSPDHPPEPPVLFFHGLVGNKRHWEGIAKTIFRLVKREAVVVDLRNHGDSPHMNSHKYEDLTADILQLIEKLGIKQASLVGHSMGGRAAMCVSLTAPHKVSGLLVIDMSPVSTPPQYISDFPGVLEAMQAIQFKNKKNITSAQNEAKVKLKEVLPVTDCLMKAVLSNIIVKPDNTIGWSCNLDVLIKHFKYISSFPSSMKGKVYHGPTMFLGGQLSDFIPPDDLPKIRTFFPKAVIKYINNTGHNLHEDDPRSFMEETIFFIRKHHYKDFPTPPAPKDCSIKSAPLKHSSSTNY